MYAFDQPPTINSTMADNTDDNASNSVYRDLVTYCSLEPTKPSLDVMAD